MVDDDSDDADTRSLETQAPTTVGLPPRPPSGPAGPEDGDDAGDPSRGTSIGRYTVLEKLGSGGMGVVFAAYDPTLDRKVALKLLRHQGVEYEARLAREAQAMARLSHANVVTVFDKGSFRGHLFLAMEFVQGSTLRAWCRASPRRWQDVLRHYLDAGRGLAAAHSAGLVHRDFKPDNVLVSRDGVVKVTDFGIARATGEVAGADPEGRAAHLAQKLSSSRPPHAEGVTATIDVPMPPPSMRDPASLDWTMTRDGTLLGTPGYMAPEQLMCESADARSDQFAFAAALYEGLYGHKPFAAPTLMEVAEATVSGRVAPPPKNTQVPARILRVLLRALSVEREDRYPSMESLLDALARDPSRRGRGVATITAGVAAVAALMLGMHRVTEARQGRLCSGAAGEAAEVWNAPIQRRIEGALLSTGAPYAADTWARTKRTLDEYVARWTAQHTQTCAATRIEGHQSEQVMTARMVCLGTRREAVRALGQVLASADRSVVERAVSAAMALPDLAACNDVTALIAAEPEPTSPAARAALAEARVELAAIKANFDAGKYALARSQAESLVERARAIDYHPLQADALLWAAKAGIDSGVTLPMTISEASDAVLEADIGRADAVRVDAAVQLIHWTANAGRYDDAAQWSKAADAVLRRLGDDGPARAAWFKATSWLSDRQGKYADAADRARKALEIARRTGETPANLAELEGGLAEALAIENQSEEAERLAAEADETIVRGFGAQHPLRIMSLTARGFVTSDTRAALGFEQEAIALAEKVSPDSRKLPTLYNNACDSLVVLGDYAAALPQCESAVRTARALDGDASEVTSVAYENTGDVLQHLGRYQEAIGAYQLALQLAKEHGTRGSVVMLALSGLGKAQLLAGDPRGAVASFERALALAAASEDRSPETQANLAGARFSLAKALYAAGARSRRAADLARDALSAMRELKRDDSAREIEAWLGKVHLAGKPPSGAGAQ